MNDFGAHHLCPEYRSKISSILSKASQTYLLLDLHQFKWYTLSQKLYLSSQFVTTIIIAFQLPWTINKTKLLAGSNC